MHPRSLLLCLVLVPASLVAADQPRWRIHAGASWVQGLEIACAAPAVADPSNAPLTDRLYDDGFNRVDATNNMGDGPGGQLASRTGYFSSQRDNQVDLTAGTLTLSTLSAATDDPGVSRDAAGTSGINLGLRYDLVPDADRWHWGFSADIDWHGRDTATIAYDETTQARLLADRYQLGGVVPQRAPYTGHYTPQPGDQRIGDTPSRTITAVDATLTGMQTIEHRLTLGRAGIWCDRRLGDRFTVSLEGGFAAGWIDADIAISDALATPAGLSSARTFAASGDANPWGWYAGMRMHLAVSSRWGIAGACSLVDLGKSGAGSLTIDASSLTLAALQVSWRF